MSKFLGSSAVKPFKTIINIKYTES